MTHETTPRTHEDERPDEEEPRACTEPAPTRPRRRAFPPVAIGLLGVVLLGAGFIVGVQVQKGSSAESGDGVPADVRAAVDGRGPGGSRASGAATGAGAAADGARSSESSSSTTGQVANIKGSTLYVTTVDGATVEVSVGSKATVQRLAKAEVSAIRPGDTVLVTGTTRSSGTVSASAVQATASGVSPLGGLRGRGSARRGSGSSPSRPAENESRGATDAAPGSPGEAVEQLFEAGD